MHYDIQFSELLDTILLRNAFFFCKFFLVTCLYISRHDVAKAKPLRVVYNLTMCFSNTVAASGCTSVVNRHH